MREKIAPLGEIPAWPSPHALGQLAQALETWGPVRTPETPAVVELWERLRIDKNKKNVRATMAPLCWEALVGRGTSAGH